MNRTAQYTNIHTTSTADEHTDGLHHPGGPAPHRPRCTAPQNTTPADRTWRKAPRGGVQCHISSSSNSLLYSWHNAARDGDLLLFLFLVTGTAAVGDEKASSVEVLEEAEGVELDDCDTVPAFGVLTDTRNERTEQALCVRAINQDDALCDLYIAIFRAPRHMCVS